MEGPTRAFLRHGAGARAMDDFQTPRRATLGMAEPVARQNAQFVRLRNFLRLPKATNWVAYEWFYSDMDKAIFGGETDFEVMLHQYFPTLSVRKLTRVEWSWIRRKLGKPRRCSEKFFQEEREGLEIKRQKVRLIQQRMKIVNHHSYHELPDEVPILASVGSPVSVWTKQDNVLDGIYFGTVEGYDVQSNCYRVKFDKTGSSYSVKDTEVMSHIPPDTVWTTSFTMKFPRGELNRKLVLRNPDLLNEFPPGLAPSRIPASASFGGYPIRLLELVVWCIKLNKLKRCQLEMLRALNVEGEKLKAYEKAYPADFKHRYAVCITELGQTNKTLSSTLEILQRYCKELVNAVSQEPSTVDEDAASIVSTYNHIRHSHAMSANRVSMPHIVMLIRQLASLMFQIREMMMNKTVTSRYDLDCISSRVTSIKSCLIGKNKGVFEDVIELPVRGIVNGLAKRDGSIK